ncbi:MAG: ABC transporter substrate-binding protein, partial [Dehalococcoidia bacterium]|nr:ABC transporter substrate-binding protein [Dehalococcoidia bacterium]
FKLDYWIKGDSYSLVKFDGYWGGWPAKKPARGGILPRGYIERVTVKMVNDWYKRRDGFLNGTYDIIHVPRSYISEVEGQPGIRCIKNLPTLSVTAMFFTFNISLTDYLGWPNSYIGEPPYEPGAIHETGIPIDFFSDIYLRKAFAYSFNYTAYIEDPFQMRGEAVRPATPVIVGLPYHNPLQEKYELNLTKAKEYFQKAWGGRVWQEGFTFTIINTHSTPTGNWPYVLKANIESLNPKFHINIAPMTWSPYLSYIRAGVSPLFVLGWLADYPDPHNLVAPFMYSEGDFTYWQKYNNTTVNTLVEEGLRELNSTRRREVYYELQRLYYEDCPSVIIVQGLGRHWERDWVQGWYYNPSYPGLYFYVLWKESVFSCDLNNDGVVDIKDVAIVAAAFGSYPSHPRWNIVADIDKNDKVNIVDVALVAKDFGKTT